MNGGSRGETGVRGLLMVKDPVCGMTIDEKTAKGQSQYNGQTYYFCAPICKTKFDQDPAKYVKS
jgi:YHS domain-containing protein